ncbi:hypothetical protein V7S76_11815 [Aquirufa sp. ROCK2-A2]
MMTTKFNKYIYLALVILGSFYLFEKSIGQALISLGIALAFDPFQVEQKWDDRPTWQKMILLLHLAIVFGLIFIEIYQLVFH